MPRQRIRTSIFHPIVVQMRKAEDGAARTQREATNRLLPFKTSCPNHSAQFQSTGMIP